jgi:hypothetical protein
VDIFDKQGPADVAQRFAAAAE